MNEMSDTTRQFVRAHRTDDVRALMLAQKRWPEVDVRQACVQIAAWQKARTKLPSWAAKDDIVFPEQLSMEQCSSELTARYKAEVWARLSGRRSADVCDLTGGLGVDASMLAQGCRRLTFVEHSEVLCDLARWNLPRMGVGRLDVVCGEAETVLPTLAQQDLIFLDPARRDSHGTHTVALADCSPDLEQLFPLLLDRATWVMAKLSPMLDISDTLRRLGHVAELHVVGVDGECKALHSPSTPTTCSSATWPRRRSVSLMSSMGDSLAMTHVARSSSRGNNCSRSGEQSASATVCVPWLSRRAGSRKMRSCCASVGSTVSASPHTTSSLPTPMRGRFQRARSHSTSLCSTNVSRLHPCASIDASTPSPPVRSQTSAERLPDSLAHTSAL